MPSHWAGICGFDISLYLKLKHKNKSSYIGVVCEFDTSLYFTLTRNLSIGHGCPR